MEKKDARNFKLKLLDEMKNGRFAQCDRLPRETELAELLASEYSAASATEGITALNVIAMAKISANSLFMFLPPFYQKLQPHRIPGGGAGRRTVLLIVSLPGGSYYFLHITSSLL
jgi:hypothetical protein